MAIVTITFKNVEGKNTMSITEKFDTDKEARDSFNSSVRFYVTCYRGYDRVHIYLLLDDGTSFTFDYSN